ncbi:MAG: serine/threonine-protein kinase [Polyangia bacterium]
MQFGRYHVVRMVGQGGMATVYEACDPRLNQRVAIKVLHAAMAASPDLVARFEAEARIVNGIRHPGIVLIYDLARLRDGAVYHVMEFLDGETLAQRLQRRGASRLSMEEIYRIGRQIADTLCTVHLHGIVHRDLKPDNLMLVPDALIPGGARVKILDFGLAKILNDNAKPSSIDTQVGTGFGTVDYIAPEQILDARNTNDRADVYALGCVLFELAVGHPPFVGDNNVQILGAHLTKPAPDLSEHAAELPRQFAALVSSMLAKEPEQRPAMRYVVQQLDVIWNGWRAQSSHTMIMPPGRLPELLLQSAQAGISKHSHRPQRANSPWLRSLALMVMSAFAVSIPTLLLIESCGLRPQPAEQVPSRPAYVPEPSLKAPKKAAAETSEPSETDSQEFTPDLDPRLTIDSGASRTNLVMR